MNAAEAVQANAAATPHHLCAVTLQRFFSPPPIEFPAPHAHTKAPARSRVLLCRIQSLGSGSVVSAAPLGLGECFQFSPGHTAAVQAAHLSQSRGAEERPQSLTTRLTQTDGNKGQTVSGDSREAARSLIASPSSPNPCKSLPIPVRLQP